MAEDFDRAVGMTLAKIDELGIRDSTYVIYMSDNGGPSRYLRGGKTNVTEGGLRVPLLVRGPGIEQDTYCDAPAVAYDLLPTVLDFADPGAVPPSRVEGGSWKPMLLSGCESGNDRPVDRMVFFFAEARGREPGPQAAIVRDNYKLLHSWAEGRAALFDVVADPREARDVALEHQDVAAGLHRELMDHLQEGLGEEALARLQSGDHSAGPPRRARPRLRENRRPERRRRPGRVPAQ